MRWASIAVQLNEEFEAIKTVGPRLRGDDEEVRMVA